MKLLPLLGLLLLFSLPLQAQEKIYTLTDCFNLSVKRSAELAGNQEEVLQAEERYRQAVDTMLPSFTGAVALGSQHSADDGKFSSQATARISADQPLFRGFRITGAIKQNEAAIKSLQEAKQWAAMQLYQDVAQAYYLLLYLRQDKKLLEEQQQIYDRRMRELQQRVAIGRSRRTEVLIFQVSRQQLQTSIAQTDLQIRTAASLMFFLTGLSGSAQLADESMTAAPLRPLAAYKVRITQRPDIKAAQQKIVGAQAGIDIAADAHSPSIDLLGNYYLQTPLAQKNTDWDVQIAITLPNFMDNTDKSKTNEAVSLKRQEEYNLKLLKQMAEESIDDIYHTLEADTTQIKLFTQAQDTSEQNVKAVTQDYNYGLSTNLDVLQAMNTMVDIKRALNKVQYAFKTDLARLASVTADIPGAGGKRP